MGPLQVAMHRQEYLQVQSDRKVSHLEISLSQRLVKGVVKVMCFPGVENSRHQKTGTCISDSRSEDG